MMNTTTTLPDWQALKTHQEQIASERMQDWFISDPERYQRFSLQVDDILLDYSKNRVTTETLQLLGNLATSLKLSEKIAALFNGHTVNITENRPALHTSLRNPTTAPVFINQENITALITETLTQMRLFTDQVRSGSWRGATNKAITDIVNIGIGGSHLGPLLATHALSTFSDNSLRCHFISNIDAAHIQEILHNIDPETTLFIVSSKSFTTLETITNAVTIKAWLQHKLGIHTIEKHFVAVTAAIDKARDFGIPLPQIFPVWDWIGGRYSVWSAIGLPLALLIGMKNFTDFLEGAHAMDHHFQTADFSVNMPVIMALLGIWYINFFGANNHAIVPYSHQLTHLRTYLQQADMESNGKSVSHTGEIINYATGPIIWGEQGCNAQHAFHQLLHQGQHFIPVDFILTGNDNNSAFDKHHDILVASGLSQAQALLQGKAFEQALAEAHDAGFTEQQAQLLARHKTISGNRPSNVIFLKKINPYNLGALLALYEHKIYVQGAIWQINSFDQWGVELGKQLLPQILDDLRNNHPDKPHDSSTQGLIQHYKSLRNA
jgi:glucose-6-phosphate isomerase